MDEKYGPLLKDTIKAIHQYKQTCMDVAEVSKLICHDSNLGDQDLNILKEKVEFQASEILGEIFTGLKKAKFLMSKDKNLEDDDDYFNNKSQKQNEEETKILSEPEAKIAEDISEFAKNNNGRGKRRKHFATNKNLDVIKIEDISVNHNYKIQNFKDMPIEHQILLLCPTKIFLFIHENYLKMKKKGIYDKYLFRSLEDNVNVIYRGNFETGKGKCNICFRFYEDNDME